ncbi:MAG: hypothetical protein ABH878_03715, partial [bacterium]
GTDRKGAVIDALPLETEGILLVKTAANGGYATFYVRHGELIPYILTIIAALIIAVSLFKTGRKA